MANQTVVIRDVTFNYPYLHTTHSPFGTVQWDVQVVVNSKEQKKAFEDAGINMKTGENNTWYTNVKRKLINRKGEENSPPKILDSEKEELAPSKIKSMGNGTKGHVKLYSYDWNVGGKSGVSAMLVALQVTDYIEYAGAGEDF